MTLFLIEWFESKVQSGFVHMHPNEEKVVSQMKPYFLSVVSCDRWIDG